MPGLVQVRCNRLLQLRTANGSKRTRLITNDELARPYAYLDHADAEGLEHSLLTLAIRLQFDFTAPYVEGPRTSMEVDRRRASSCGLA